MKKIEAVMTLWAVWFEDDRGLDFDTWMDKHGRAEAEKIRDKVMEARSGKSSSM